MLRWSGHLTPGVGPGQEKGPDRAPYVKHLLKNVKWYSGSGGEMYARCGVLVAGNVENEVTMTSLVNWCTCHRCLEAVLKYSDSQIVLDRYAELERMAGETSVNPS